MKNPKTPVLVADDCDDNHVLLAAYCQGTDYDLTFVENGAAAVAAFREQSFATILMDIDMPVMDGLTAIRTIRAIEARASMARTPILTLTSNVSAADVRRSQLAGCDRHLGKSISKADLLHELQRWTAVGLSTLVRPPCLWHNAAHPPAEADIAGLC